MKSCRIVFFPVLFLLWLVPASSLAMNAGMGPDLLTIEDSPIPLTVRASSYYIWGESNEYVYDPETGDKISQLDWDLENIVMVGGSISARFTDWLQLNFGGWAAVNEGDGRMVDRDWDFPGEDWTDRSVSDVYLDHGYVLDVNVAFPLEMSPWFTISPMVGFSHDNWEWHDQGGSYVYSRDGWRDSTGDFADETGIRYEQWFYAPYIGLNLSVEYEGFFANAYVKGTPWAWSEDKDQHLLRDLEFKESIYNQSYIGTGVEIGYDVTDCFYIMAGYDYQEFMSAKGGTTTTDTVTGESSSDGNSAGIGHHLNSVSLSFGFKF